MRIIINTLMLGTVHNFTAKSYIVSDTKLYVFEVKNGCATGTMQASRPWMSLCQTGSVTWYEGLQSPGML
jgi:hypothetical protein